jgi:hypothetical protein
MCLATVRSSGTVERHDSAPRQASEKGSEIWSSSSRGAHERVGAGVLSKVSRIRTVAGTVAGQDRFVLSIDITTG